MAKQYVTVEQFVSPGGLWTGVEPTTTPAINNGIKTYPADVVGGMFTFAFTSFHLLEVERIVADFGGIASKLIVIKSPGRPDIDVFRSTLATQIKLLWTSPIKLAPGEQIVVTAVGPAIVQTYVAVTVRPWLPSPPEG